MTLLTVLFYILFVVAAIVLIVVVLLQEGRGGGFGEALGSHGRETFGVGSKGINTFTAWTAAVFLASALVIHVLNRRSDSETLLGDDAAPALSAPAGDAPPVTPSAPPPTAPSDK
jgi:preprotein translocase subunit SecG